MSISNGDFPVLYSDADLAWLREQILQDEVLALVDDIEPEAIDSTYWGIATESWAVLSREQQQAVAANHIVEDRWVMRRAGIDPEEWEVMSLDEREEIIRAARQTNS